MKTTGRVIPFFFCILLLAGTLAFAADEEPAAVTMGEKCCFENPRFSGTCQVTPGADETCGSILGYLNNPNSVGKAYCGNTKVRGGWTQVSCEGATATSVNSCQMTEIGE